MADEGAPISVRVSGRQIEALPDVEGKTIEEARQSIRSRPFSLEVTTVESTRGRSAGYSCRIPKAVMA
jgi:hypothetical protein